MALFLGSKFLNVDNRANHFSAQMTSPFLPPPCWVNWSQPQPFTSTSTHNFLHNIFLHVYACSSEWHVIYTFTSLCSTMVNLLTMTQMNYCYNIPSHIGIPIIPTPYLHHNNTVDGSKQWRFPTQYHWTGTNISQSL